MKKLYFAHGKESGPWGTKIAYLAEIAKKQGYTVISPDYSNTHNPEERVERLLTLLEQDDDISHLVLVGSSMGGYISTIAAAAFSVKGVFLMAPALFMPGYSQSHYPVCSDHVSIVHGWNDDVIPVEHSIRFAQADNYELVLLNSDHRLNDVLPQIGRQFGDFLARIEEPQNEKRE